MIIIYSTGYQGCRSYSVGSNFNKLHTVRGTPAQVGCESLNTECYYLESIQYVVLYRLMDYVVQGERTCPYYPELCCALHY
jgi:hypothetical protein